MPKMSTVDRQRGAALILPLFLTVVLGLAVVYVMRWSSFANRTITEDAQVTSYKNFVSSLRQALYAGNGCSDILNLKNSTVTVNNSFLNPPTSGGNWSYPNPINWGQSMTLHWNYGQHEGPIREALPGQQMWKIPGGTTVHSVRMKVDGPVIRSRVFRDIPNDRAMTARLATLVVVPAHGGVTLRRHNPATNSSINDPNFVISLLVYYTTGTRRLIGCYSPNGPAAACTVQGMAWNELMPLNSPADYFCNPDIACKISAQGAITGTSNLCIFPYVQRRYNNNLYVCSWCNQNAHL